jgi:hypothetical protein
MVLRYSRHASAQSEMFERVDAFVAILDAGPSQFWNLFALAAIAAWI